MLLPLVTYAANGLPVRATIAPDRNAVDCGRPDRRQNPLRQAAIQQTAPIGKTPHASCPGVED